MAMMTAKDRWNSEHYTQIKVWADKALASAFKSACDKNGVSYASVITSMMSEYLGVPCIRHRETEHTRVNLSKRDDRRREIRRIVASLEEIMTAESGYMERIPENMQDGERHQAAEQSIDLIEEAIEALRDAY
jgi:hypothetical protein